MSTSKELPPFSSFHYQPNPISLLIHLVPYNEKGEISSYLILKVAFRTVNDTVLNKETVRKERRRKTKEGDSRLKTQKEKTVLKMFPAKRTRIIF